MSAIAGTSVEAQRLARQVGSHAQLIRAICTFNQNPADYIDDSRRPDFFAQPAGDALWKCERARRHLSQHILERVGAEPCLETMQPEWPVALLDRPQLDRLARHVSAAIVGPRVRRALSRVEVIRWREWLSSEAHEFALTRASLLPFHADAGHSPETTTAEHLGHAWIVAASKRWHTAIARRFMLKLPAGSYKEVEAIDGALASRLVISVLSTLETRWCSSFATMRT
ncbi:SctK family type III secretion system sorting platform protein [Caenimonas sp. SL110]|uniref:SctK family type III secretion system sorting platform protein n=1 Tax=Caenimonas sp. SL110 TaxID=1450524 RepID=UPI00069F0301|nr:SctK family type III secretion system sorting platform protein [Caenimonas sp. SL110]